MNVSETKIKIKTRHFRENANAPRFICGIVVKPEAVRVTEVKHDTKRCKNCVKLLKTHGYLV